MLRLLFCGVLAFISFHSYAADNSADLLPIPLSESATKCTDGLYIVKTGRASIGTAHNERNIHSTLKGVVGRAVVERWNRFAMIYSRWESPTLYYTAKPVSGNLKDVALVVGKTFEGQVTQSLTFKDKPATIDVKVTIKIQSVQKVNFNNRLYTAYKILTTTTNLTPPPQYLSAEILYLPELQEFYSMKVDTTRSGRKRHYECHLESNKQGQPIAPLPTPSKSKPAPAMPRKAR